MYVILKKSIEFGKFWYVSSLSSCGICLTLNIEKALHFEERAAAYAFLVLASFYPTFEILDHQIFCVDEEV